MRARIILEQLHMVDRLWQMSLLACAVIGFVLLLRLFLKRCSKGYSYVLWLLVLLRLLCPVLIESDYSAQPTVLTGESAVEKERQDQERLLKDSMHRGSRCREAATCRKNYLWKAGPVVAWAGRDRWVLAAMPELVHTEKVQPGMFRLSIL